MTASHRGGLGDGRPHIVASGRWRGHNDRPVDLTAARRRVAVRDIATGTVPIAVGWSHGLPAVKPTARLGTDISVSSDQLGPDGGPRRINACGSGLPALA
jgi:hypothetical protein